MLNYLLYDLNGIIVFEVQLRKLDEEWIAFIFWLHQSSYDVIVNLQ